MSGSPGRTRTSDQLINSQPLYQLSYRGMGSWQGARFWSKGPAQVKRPLRSFDARARVALAYAFKTLRMRSTDSASSSFEQAKEIRT